MSPRILIPFLSVLLIGFRYFGRADESADLVKPEHYDIKILVDIDDAVFTGEVNVLMKCIVPTDAVKINAGDMDIDKDKVTVVDAVTSELKIVKSVEIDKTDEEVVIKLEEKLTKDGKYIMYIEYKAKLQDIDYPKGFYRNHYFDNNIEHYVATTIFEPFYARLAFPCFDFPHMKATFQMTIGHHEKFFALNNMPLVKKEPIEGKTGWIWEHFDKTPPMSTYIVAFAVLDDNIKSVSSGKISWWYPRDTAMSIDYQDILKLTVEYFNYIEGYFGVKYELPKLDFLVVLKYPSYAGASENWGLVTIQEVLFKGDDVLMIIAHEIVHQWVGNLITMKSFGEVWLKEGLTTFFQNIMIDRFNKLKSIDTIISTMLKNSIAGSQVNPLSVDYSPKNLNTMLELYGAANYERGCLFTRMLDMTLGFNGFNNIINVLLNKFKYQNYDEDDFFITLGDAAQRGNFPENLNIVKVFKSWTKQAGIPIVEVARNFDNGTATLTQYSLVPPGEEKCWWIPIAHTTKSEKNFKSTVPTYWMTCPNVSLVLSNLRSEDWILINLQSAGLFVVKYDSDNWSLLTNTLNDLKNFEIIPFWDRFKLILDLNYLSFSGLFPHKSFLNILLYLKHEKNFIVWGAAIKYLNQLKFEYDVDSRREYIKNIVSSHFSRTLFNHKSTSAMEAVFKSFIIKEACEVGIAECLDEVFRLFNEFKCSYPNSTVNKEVRRIIFSIAVKYGPPKYKEFLSDIKLKTEESDLIGDINSALFFFFKRMKIDDARRYVKTIPEKQLLNISRSGDFGISLFSSINPEFSALVELDLSQRDPQRMMFYLDRLLRIASELHDSQTLDLLKRTFKDKKFDAFNQKTKQIIESVQSNIDWEKKYADEIKLALLSFSRKLDIVEGNRTAKIPTSARINKPNEKESGSNSHPLLISFHYLVVSCILLVTFFE